MNDSLSALLHCCRNGVTGSPNLTTRSIPNSYRSFKGKIVAVEVEKRETDVSVAFQGEYLECHRPSSKPLLVLVGDVDVDGSTVVSHDWSDCHWVGEEEG